MCTMVWVVHYVCLYMLNLLLQEDAVTPGNAVAPDTLATLLTLYTMCACIPHTACDFNNLCFPVSISSCVMCLRIKFVFNMMHPSIYLSFKCYLPFLVFTTSTWDACNKWGILDFITLSRAAFVSFGVHGDNDRKTCCPFTCHSYRDWTQINGQNCALKPCTKFIRNKSVSKIYRKL